MSQPVAIGMDIGGTLVRLGAFDLAGQRLGQKEASVASIGPERGLRLIEDLIHDTVESVSGSLLGIGIGCTGPLDIRRGLVNNPYTLDGWSNVPIVEYLSQALH
ncbi:MAG: ROK family protein, partial [Byssovorax cruenta]